MIYTRLTRKALQICFDAHKEQKDKTGLPYVFHPFHLAEQMTDEVSVCAALLHDVVEDTDMTIDDLRNQGFPDEVLDVVSVLTHDPDVPYFDYISKIADYPTAVKVKLADLAHNSDITRLDNVDEAMERRLEKYKKAKQILTKGKDYTAV